MDVQYLSAIHHTKIYSVNQPCERAPLSGSSSWSNVM